VRVTVLPSTSLIQDGYARAPGRVTVAAGSTICWLETIRFKVCGRPTVLMPDSGAEPWTLLGDDGDAVEPAERYLAYLASIERSPNTVRAYAVNLKLWFEFLAWAGLSWQLVGIEDVGPFRGLATGASVQRRGPKPGCLCCHGGLRGSGGRWPHSWEQGLLWGLSHRLSAPDFSQLRTKSS
jgi:hypothetical protein